MATCRNIFCLHGIDKDKYQANIKLPIIENNYYYQDQSPYYDLVDSIINQDKKEGMFPKNSISNETILVIYFYTRPNLSVDKQLASLYLCRGLINSNIWDYSKRLVQTYICRHEFKSKIVFPYADVYFYWDNILI